MEYGKKLNNTFDDLIENINIIFDQFAIAYTYHDLGKKYICDIDDETEVFPEFCIGNDRYVEWPSIRDVKLFKDNYPFFLVEVFHNKLSQEWQYCLNDIFSIYIDTHLSDEGPFLEHKDSDFSDIKLLPEYKVNKVKLCFDSKEALIERIKDVCKNDFEFESYPEKIRLIKKIFYANNPDLDIPLFNIHKNIEIRNIIQHHNGIIDNKTIQKLGKNKIELLNNDGNYEFFEIGDKVELSFPELNSFKNAIIYVIKKWRDSNEYN